MRRIALAGVVVVALGALSPVAAQAAPAPLSVQHIPWVKCFQPDPAAGPDEDLGEYGRLECGVYKVPRDWAHPGDGRTLDMIATRLPARNGKARGAVFTNPGGPGASGTIMPMLWGLAKKSRLAEEMDLYGIDVRGVFQLTCGEKGHGDTPDSRDRRPKNVARLLRLSKAIAKDCQARPAQRYVTTAQTVRDLDLLRSLIGQEKINWVGYSGGSWLGAHYAAQFPRRTGRFVLDSNVQFTGGWQEAFNLQPKGFERRFREDFAPWAARNHKSYKIGRTAKQVIAVYEGIRRDVAREPLPLYGSELRPADVDGLIAGAMYVKDAFPTTGTLLALMRRYTGLEPNGRAAAAGTLNELVRSLRTISTPLHTAAPEDEEPPRDSEDATFYAITCNDTAHRGTPKQLAARSAKLGKKYPLIGWSTIIDPCQYWKRRPGLALKRPGRNLPGMLMVQSVHDPATPYEGALKAHRVLRNSRLLTVKGEGDHGVYFSGNACVDRIVEAYLIDGRFPKKDLTCKGLPLPGAGGSDVFFRARNTPANPLQAIAGLTREHPITR
ncbi:alpha/beta hydrolase [Actinocorallia longicatena]|uniref:Alpha/beta hydrolase n=1 Tax=Actinocorallia longicatena TaxID=111803 RepID=A0ABP6Q2I2_9ACTN